MKMDFLVFVRVVAQGDLGRVSKLLQAEPTWATESVATGASRQNASEYFLADIAHYVYAGDTALHIAAAAFQVPVARRLVEQGASCRAKNRLGAEPLHYAADAHRESFEAQAAIITYLLSIGADPNATDRSGVAPLHRAVRTRSVRAVEALLDGGADARRPNKSGSTPLHLAVQTTGRSGSGSARSREQQIAIVTLLRRYGAKLEDRDGRNQTAREAASDNRILELLDQT